MNDERRRRGLIVAVVGYVVAPSAVLGVGLLGDGLGVALVDFSALAVELAASIGVLGVLAGAMFKLVPSPEPGAAPGGESATPGSEDGDTSREDEATPEAEANRPRGRTLELVVVGVIALLAGALATVSGEFNTAIVLFWVCVPYGVGIATAYRSLRSGRSANDPAVE